MERKYFKALNFDLDTHQLQEHYPGANYRQAYDDLRRFFKRHHFSHRQGSGYISDEKLTTADIYDLMDDLSQQLPWIGLCVNKIDVTNVGRQHVWAHRQPGLRSLKNWYLPIMLSEKESRFFLLWKEGNWYLSCRNN